MKKAAELRKEREARREAEAPPRLELAEGESVTDAILSEDEVHVYATVSVKATGSKTVEVPNYITESSYPEPIPARTRVGDNQNKRRLAILNLKTRKSVWVSLPLLKTESKTAEGQTETKDREVVWSMIDVSGDGSVAVADANAADNKDRWLVRLDPETGVGTVLFAEHDDAWINRFSGSAGLLKDGRTLWFTSEKPGFMHLFAVDASAGGPEAKALTSGAWEISDVQLSADQKTFYHHQHRGGCGGAAPLLDAGERRRPHPHHHGRGRARRGGVAGWLPPCHCLLGGNKPPEVFVGPSSNNLAKRVTTSPSAEWLAGKWLDPKIVMVPARDGVKVPARIYRPRGPGRPGQRSPAWSSCTAPATCTTSTITGRRIPASTCSTTSWPPTDTRCSTWTTAAPPGTVATGAPPSIGGWAART